LQRARQATTVAGLSDAAAEQAFFASNGAVIKASATFVADDPMAAKQVSALPFYKVLPR
jgi:hypothetical protein